MCSVCNPPQKTYKLVYLDIAELDCMTHSKSVLTGWYNYIRKIVQLKQKWEVVFHVSR